MFMFSCIYQVFAEVWMELTMFFMAMIFYVFLSGGFTTVELKQKKKGKCVDSPPAFPTTICKANHDQACVDRATMLKLRPLVARKGNAAKVNHVANGSKKVGADQSGATKQRRKQNAHVEKTFVAQPPVAPAAVSPIQQQETPEVPPTIMPTAPESEQAEFTPAGFRRELSAILKDLALDRKTGDAVGRIRSLKVPAEHQAAEFADLLTRASEENRGAIRFVYIAFAAGLAATGRGPWVPEECLRGLRLFFDEIYCDLCEEIPRLPRMMQTEFLPTLRSVLPLGALDPLVPLELMQN